ncbi:hypothetical protein G7046_g238 [Stylonectria norvegica]|nr:hypothetical protein G7046_g238 [Stylonectria norvegica]
MGQPSSQASNAIIYVTYALFLLLGTGVAWRMRKQSKADFLAGNGTQTGQENFAIDRARDLHEKTRRSEPQSESRVAVELETPPP